MKKLLCLLFLATGLTAQAAEDPVDPNTLLRELYTSSQSDTRDPSDLSYALFATIRSMEADSYEIYRGVFEPYTNLEQVIASGFQLPGVLTVLSTEDAGPWQQIEASIMLHKSICEQGFCEAGQTGIKIRLQRLVRPNMPTVIKVSEIVTRFLGIG